MIAQRKGISVLTRAMLAVAAVSVVVLACDTPATEPAGSSPVADVVPADSRMKVSAEGNPLLMRQAAEALQAAEAAGGMESKTSQRRPATPEEIAEMEAAAQARGSKTRQPQPR